MDLPELDPLDPPRRQRALVDAVRYLLQVQAAREGDPTIQVGGTPWAEVVLDGSVLTGRYPAVRTAIYEILSEDRWGPRFVFRGNATPPGPPAARVYLTYGGERWKARVDKDALRSLQDDDVPVYLVTLAYGDANIAPMPEWQPAGSGLGPIRGVQLLVYGPPTGRYALVDPRAAARDLRTLRGWIEEDARTPRRVRGTAERLLEQLQ